MCVLVAQLCPTLCEPMDCVSFMCLSNILPLVKVCKAAYIKVYNRNQFEGKKMVHPWTLKSIRFDYHLLAVELTYQYLCTSFSFSVNGIVFPMAESYHAVWMRTVYTVMKHTHRVLHTHSLGPIPSSQCRLL